MNELFRNKGIEIDIIEPDNFKKIIETLTRIGHRQRFQGINTDELEQLCHILHKRDDDGISRYSILHFKEMYEMDGFPSTKDDVDIAIRNKIVKLLEEWKLIKIVNEQAIGNIATIDLLTVIPFKDKDKWILKQMYKMKVRTKNEQK